jgi:hypothetical protein
MTNLCDVCGKPATHSMLKDPFGKSYALRFVCDEHGFRIRDPADVAEIERLDARLSSAAQQIIDFENSGHAMQAEIEWLRATILQVQQAQLDWAMVCECQCAACETFSNAIRLIGRSAVEPTAHEPLPVDPLPEGLRDPIKVMERVRELQERCRSGLGYQGEFMSETQCTLKEGHSGPHNYASDPRGTAQKPLAPQAPIAKITVRESGAGHYAPDDVYVRLYAPGLPPGEHDVYCEPMSVAPALKSVAEEWEKAKDAMSGDSQQSCKQQTTQEDRAYYNGARAAAAMAHQSISVMDKWINDGCSGRVPALKSGEQWQNFEGGLPENKL